MAQDTDQLKAEIDQQRAAISGTVEQIENRVSPSRVMARRQDRFRRRLTEMRDTVFGNDEPDYPSSNRQMFAYDSGREPWTRPAYASDCGEVFVVAASSGGSSFASSTGETSAVDSVQHAPQALRRQTRGNPMAAGLVALAGGWLFGSLLPESRQERQLAKKLEPEMADAAAALKSQGVELVHDLTEPVMEAVEDLKQTSSQAAQSVVDQARTH